MPLPEEPRAGHTITTTRLAVQQSNDTAWLAARAAECANAIKDPNGCPNCYAGSRRQNLLAGGH